MKMGNFTYWIEILSTKTYVCVRLMECNWIITDHNVSVEWDTSMIFPYHYDTDGFDQASHVVICDEPRILLQREKIAVGCLVQRG